MTQYVQKRPTVEAIFYDGTNAQEVVDFLGTGSVSEDGVLTVTVFGSTLPVAANMYLGKPNPNYPDGGPQFWSKEAFESNWEAA